MKFSSVLFLFFFLVLLLSPITLAEPLDISLTDGTVKNITSSVYEKSPFMVKYFSNNETQVLSPDIMWKEKGNEFWVRFNNDSLYNTKVKDAEVLKVALTEVHFEVNQLKSEEVCLSNQYYQSCYHSELSFADFEANNIITNKTITSLYPEGWDGWWTCIKENNFIFVNEVVECMETPNRYLISYEGIITNLDPSIDIVYSSSSQLYVANQTEATNFGVSLIYNGTAQTGYNATQGTFDSFVYFNSTPTYWNVTMSLANASGNDITQSLCDADANCVSYWSLDGYHGNTNYYNDSKGTNHGTPTGTTNVTGISSDGLDFDGSDVITTSSFSHKFAEQSFTVSAWMKTSQTDFEGIMSYGDRFDNVGWTALYFTNGLPRFIIDDGTTQIIINRTGNYADNLWHFYTATIDRDNDVITIYMDGEFNANESIATIGNNMTTADAHDVIDIGAYWYENAYFAIGYTTGSIDEVLIYNDSLSASEVQALYKAGLSQHANTNITLQTRTANNYNLSDVGLVSFWALNNDSTIDENATTVVDSTGRNNGTIIGATWSQENGTVGGGFYFDQDADYMLIPDSASWNLSGSNEFSAFAWVKGPSQGAADAVIIGQYDTGANQRAWVMQASFTAPTKLNTYISNDGTVGEGTFISGATDTVAFDDTWHHVGITFVGGKLNMYVDGVNSTFTQGGSAITTIHDSTAQGCIGCQLNSGTPRRYFKGNIDEVRIYNRSLSAAEVLNLYEMGSYHIEDWSEWTDAGLMVDGVANNNTGNGSFFQFKPQFWSNTTTGSPYLLNHSVGVTEQPSGAPAGDTTIPSEINITIPLNQTYTINQTELNMTCSDETAQSSWWYSIGATNYTSVEAGTNFTGVPYAEGSNTIVAYCNDTSNNINATSRTFYVDTINPEISISSPENSTNWSTDSITINITVGDESDIQSEWYSNDSGENNHSFTVGTNITSDWEQGWNIITIWANDSLGNENSTTISLYVDSINPALVIIYPTPTTYPFIVTELNYTSSDGVGTLSSCWYSLDAGSNSSGVAPGLNFSGLTSNEGSNTWHVYCNDTLNNINATSRTFTIDTTPPTISITYPQSTSYVVNITHMNATIGDAAFCWYYNGTGNTTIVCGVNATSLTDGEGTHTWFWYGNDTLGNEGFDSVTFDVHITLVDPCSVIANRNPILKIADGDLPYVQLCYGIEVK